MKKEEVALACPPRTRDILAAFSVPKTPRCVEREHGIAKLRMKTFLEEGLVRPLNPEARKGRLYILTHKARRLVQLSGARKTFIEDWGPIGWVLASPRQRLVILKVIDLVKRTSEKIRDRASRFNPRLTRISTKTILKELINKDLANSEINNLKRYYWISVEGSLVLKHIESMATIETAI